MKNILFHWKRDYHNRTDLYVHSHEAFKLTSEPLPTSVDLRKFCAPVFDQGELGSCTGNALVGALEYLENKDKDFEVDGQFVNLSRLFVYYNERLVEGDVSEDGGAQISTGIKVLAETGAATEDMWPYQIWKYTAKPSKKAYQDAATRKITAYARVDRSTGIDAIKTVLASGYPIVFGFTVFDSFMSPQVAKTGVLNMPKSNEGCEGGHAVLCVGYDDATQTVLVRNSWGPNWGQAGYFTMPYQYIMDENLANDLW